jgi:signal transduction histidine kinase
MPKLFSGKKLGSFWSSLSVSRQGVIVIAIPTACLGIALGAWIWSRQSERTAYYWLECTEQVIYQSDRLLRVLVDAETGVRGYYITREAQFLEPYQQAIQELPATLEQLDSLVQRPELQQQLQDIDLLAQQRIEKLVQILEIIQIEEQAASQLPQFKDLFIKSKNIMDAIRVAVNEFQNQQRYLLDLRTQRLNNVRKITDILLASTFVISLLGLWAAIYLYRQAENKLKNRADELANLNTVFAKTNVNLENRNRELDQFSYVVSHDLKAPLRAIANLSEWLEEDLEDKLTDDTRKQMNLLRGRVHRMEALINGLLHYSRVGRIKGDLEFVDVGKLLAEVLDSLAPPAEFTINIEGEMPTLVTESLPLQQVFTNLISNGIKHHDRSDGKIVISVKEQEKFYQFFVKDDGPGIAPEYHQKIFGIFQTLTARDQQENTGIGLSIVKKIIEHHGGKICVQSNVGQGTTFYFTWPK